MAISRRALLYAGGATFLSPLVHGRPHGLKIGVTDWNLRLTGKLEAVETAARLRFDGVQVSLGRKPVDGRLPLDDLALQQQYLTASKIQKIALDGTCLDILHVNYLKNDKLGQKWVADSIPITKKLEARVVLLPFFGKGALATHDEMDYVGDVLREVRRVAADRGRSLVTPLCREHYKRSALRGGIGTRFPQSRQYSGQCYRL